MLSSVRGEGCGRVGPTYHKVMEAEQLLIVYKAYILLLLTVCSSLAKDIRVSLDGGDSHNNCSSVMKLESGDETTVTSSGRAPNGYCSVAFYSVDDTRYTCSKLCVTVRRSRMITCDAKLKFTAVYFSKDQKDVTKEFDCRHKLEPVWCMTTNFLRLEIIESYKYAYEWNKHLYGFELDVSPQCDVGVGQGNEYSKYMEDLEEKSSKTKTEGIIVACCLSAIFLITLGIMYCYYKQKAISGPPTDVHIISKGSLAGFRAKFNLGRFTHHSTKNQNAEPQLHAYRSKHSPPAAAKADDKHNSIEDRNESPFLTPPEGTGDAAEETADDNPADEQTVTVELEEIPLCDSTEQNQTLPSN